MSTDPLVLLDVSRNGFLESHHRGAFVLLDAGGTVACTAGAPTETVFPRSALKPVQAVALVECGYPGRESALALAAASHDGEDVHRAGVSAILAASGLTEAALQCPADLPSSHAAMLAHVRAGGGPERICHNCSGKHAAMLATCMANGWDPSSYLAPSHPLQVAIVSAVERLAGEPVTATGVDGCGAPAHAISLLGLARTFGALATASTGPSTLVCEAMRAWPALIGGTGRAVSELTAAVDGLVCKDGAEGVWAAALPDGRAFAAKIEDGGQRALGPVLAAALRYWGIDSPTVRQWSSVAVLGGGQPVGAIAPSAAFSQRLGLDSA